MDFLQELWLPILATAFAAFVASALIWMVAPHHKKEFTGLPDENSFTSFVRGLKLPPGTYMFPFAADGKCNTPEMQQKMKEGPAGMLKVFDTQMSMGRNMFLTFVAFLCASALIGYLGYLYMHAGHDHGTAEAAKHAHEHAMAAGKKFQFFGTAGLAVYCFSTLPQAIWFGSTRTIANTFIDGVIYGLITGGIFTWLA